VTLQDVLNHLLNFAAPALLLAVLLPLLSRLVMKKPARRVSLWGQMTVIFAAGVSAQLASVWWLGRDGKMLGYAALVLSVATSQWLLARGWHR